MNATTTYGVDIAKNVMQVHWVDQETGEICRKKMARGKLAEFFAKRQSARVVMEACGGAHHWGRALGALGHQVELLPASQVRAFVRGNKDDAADARAIWLAAHHGDIRRVPVKSSEQQATLSLHRVRQHWVDIRRATANMLRGLLYEFGVVLPVKSAGFKALAERRALIDPQLPAVMNRLVDTHLLALKEIDQKIHNVEVEIAVIEKSSETARRLRQIPGVGLLGATALAAALGDGSGWRSGRDFSCCLGLAPQHTGTGGKVRMGGISKRGDPYIRNLLINGARAVIANESVPEWATQMLKRRPFNVVVVAMAHKLARTAWALTAHQRSYQSEWQSVTPTRAAALTT